MPAVPPLPRHRLPLVTAGAALALLALVMVVEARLPAPVRMDWSVSEHARDLAHAEPWWRTVMSVITRTADTVVVLSAGLVAVLTLLWRGRRVEAVFLIAAGAVGAAVRHTILHLVDRPRPVDRLTPAAGWAFPSGHTTSATITAGIAIVLCLALLRSGRLRALLIAAAAGWAVLVGISRVALLAHWPTDVLAGWLLSVAVVTGLYATRLRPPSVE